MPSPSDGDDATDVSSLSEAELYRVVHRATKDAVLDAVGTVLLTGIGVVLFVAGLSAALGALDIGGVVLGGALAALGCYLMLTPLDVVPGIRDLG